MGRAASDGERKTPGDQVLNVLAHARDASKSKTMTNAVMKTLIGTLAAVSPIPAAMVLFGEGVVHIHHAHRAHQVARAADGDQVARAMLAEVGEKIDQTHARASAPSRRAALPRVRAGRGPLVASRSVPAMGSGLTVC